MKTVMCLMRESDGRCSVARLLVDVDGTDLVCADRPARLSRVGTTTLLGWGTLDGPAIEYKDEACAWTALVPESEARRIGADIDTAVSEYVSRLEREGDEISAAAEQDAEDRYAND